MTRTPLTISDLAFVGGVVFFAGLLGGAGPVGLIAFAAVAHSIAIFGAPVAAAGAAVFILTYLLDRSAPRWVGAAAGYALSAGWLWYVMGPYEPVFTFAIPGAIAGFFAAHAGRRALIARGHPV